MHAKYFKVLFYDKHISIIRHDSHISNTTNIVTITIQYKLHFAFCIKVQSRIDKHLNGCDPIGHHSKYQQYVHPRKLLQSKSKEVAVIVLSTNTVTEDLNVEISAVMILMTRMPDKTSANVLEMYHLIVYIIGLKQQHDGT